MVSSYLIEKWKRMIKHESVLHIEQQKGKFYSATELAGYYNDLRGKVKNTKNIDDQGIPYNIAAHGKDKKVVYFPIAIFQYGLGAYDLWLETKRETYLTMMLKMADWAVKHQEANGAWDTFGVLQYSNPYSAMAQGEGASLCARAYKETQNEKYLQSSVRAIEFMLKPHTEGGTTDYRDDKMILLEYPAKPAVLNGWMFSGFGILDCWKITKDDKFLKAWEKTVTEIEAMLPQFDANHWSYYDCGGKYTSPFYHNLHIYLLRAYYDLTESEVMKDYADKWEKCRDSQFYSKIAFLVKAWQKVTEKKGNEWFFAE